MKRTSSLAVLVLSLAAAGLLAVEIDPTSVGVSENGPSDSRRFSRPKTLDDYFPFKPPATRAAWEARKKELRQQLLVALGLWPMPEKTPLNPVIHGKIDRHGYTIEKVYFASLPGFYVCGNLYRPKGRTGKLPGVLCPHGHWANGRFYDAGEKQAQALIKHGDEKTIEGARYPLQARCAMLARMGCVVFHYDMVGYADSQQIPHRVGFTDAEAELPLQSFMGLQTWDSIRALDFLLSLPEVDPKRIGVTGASGGGTQTFILCAVDDRPTVAFPAVMVSTAMQGGCVCENCSYLRQFTGNVEIAGLFAPKPLGMTGAHDWTIDIETKGLPQLKALYRLYGAEDKVMAKCFPQFQHNYNQVSREVMYNWFNKHLKLGLPEPVVEKPFVPVPPKELSVFDKEHPLPKDAVNVKQLREYLTKESDKQMAALKNNPGEFRKVVGTALGVMIHDRLPGKGEVVRVPVGSREKREGTAWDKAYLRRKDRNEAVPVLTILPRNYNGTLVVWIHPEGQASLVQDGKLVPEARRFLDRGAAILAVDVFGTGELQGPKPRVVDPKYAGFTFGYNRPLLAERVHDILTAVAGARYLHRVRKVHLVGFGKAGPWVVLARALCGDKVNRTAADLNRFSFQQVKSTGDEMMLPGALKYGDLPAFAALCAPGELYLYNQPKVDGADWTRAAYQAADASGKLATVAGPVKAEKMVDWLLR